MREVSAGTATVILEVSRLFLSEAGLMVVFRSCVGGRLLSEAGRGESVGSRCGQNASAEQSWQDDSAGKAALKLVRELE